MNISWGKIIKFIEIKFDLKKNNACYLNRTRFTILQVATTLSVSVPYIFTILIVRKISTLLRIFFTFSLKI